MKRLRHWLCTGKTYSRHGMTVMWIYHTRQNEIGAEMKGISKGLQEKRYRNFISQYIGLAVSTVYFIK